MKCFIFVVIFIVCVILWLFIYILYSFTAFVNPQICQQEQQLNTIEQCVILESLSTLYPLFKEVLLIKKEITLKKTTVT